MVKIVLPAFLFCLAQLCGFANAQVYRCEIDGKTHYSDEPCMGARRVEVTPTRGLDKLSGTSRKGRDVRQEEFNKQAADILRPIFRETPEQRATRHRRARNHLTPEETAECYSLDSRIQRLEQQESVAKNQALRDVQGKLLAHRQRQRNLKC